MKDNKEIGFDILENSDINEIDEIGADNMMIDKSARDRMLKIANKIYKEEKEILDKEQGNEHISENEDAVTGVENYSRKGISRIIYTALSSAALLAIVCGSIYMLGRNKGVSPYTPEPLEKATTTIISETTVNTTETTTGTATATKSTSATKTSVTDTNVKTVASAEITTAEAAKETPANNAETAVTEIDPKWTSKYDSIDPADATQEKLDDAFQRAMDKFMFAKNFYGYGETSNPYNVDISTGPIWDIKADMRDINGDSVPELFISYDMRGESGPKTIMFLYDGNEFIAPTVRGHDYDGNDMFLYMNATSFRYDYETKCITLYDFAGYSFIRKIRFDKDNSFTLVEEYNYTGYFKNGNFIFPYEIGKNDPITNGGNNYLGEMMNAETLYAEKNIKAEMYEERPYDYPGY